jgi:hypothetical protein
MNFLKSQNQCFCLNYRNTTPYDFLKLVFSCDFKQGDALLIVIDSEGGQCHEFSELISSLQSLKIDKKMQIIISLSCCIGQVYSLAVVGDRVYTTGLTKIGKFDTSQGSPYVDLFQTIGENLMSHAKLGPKTFIQPTAQESFIDIIQKYRPNVLHGEYILQSVSGQRALGCGLVDELKDMYTIRKELSIHYTIITVEPESKIDLIGLATKYLARQIR